MARPKKYIDRVQTMISMSRETKELLRKQADMEGFRDFNTFVMQCISEHVNLYVAEETLKALKNKVITEAQNLEAIKKAEGREMKLGA